MQYAAVLVDNRNLSRFVEIRNGATGRINLTTIAPNQPQAKIEIFLARGRRRTLVHTFKAADLNRVHHPEIVVTGYVRGELVLTLRVNGEMVSRVSVPVTVRTRPPWLLPTLLISLFAVGAVIGIWYLVQWLREPYRQSTPASRPQSAGTIESTEESPSGTLPGGTSEPDTGSGPGSVEQEDEPGDDEASAQANDADGEGLFESEESGESSDLPDGTGESGPAATDNGAASGADGSVAAAQRSEGVWQVEQTWTLYFAAESAVLLPEALMKLSSVVAAAGAPSEAPALLLRLTGHTALYDDEASRLELSVERADAVRHYLEDNGVTVTMEASGVGGAEPVTRADYDQWLNRRVEVELLAQDQ